MTARRSQRFFQSPRYLNLAPLVFGSVALLLPLAVPVKADSPHTPAADQALVLGSLEIVQGAILLRFVPADGGLRLTGPGRGAFEIAGADHIWLPAEAHMANGAILVSTSLIQQPIVVRYHWQTLTAAVLFNSKGLPVAPFVAGN
jgi:hypothetical protein